MPKLLSTETLETKLVRADVYDEFCALMFDEELRYDDLMEKLESWGISSSKGALSRFNVSHRGPWAMERARLQHEKFLADNGATLDDTTRRLIAMRIFQDAASPNTSTKDVLRMAELEVQRARLQQDGVKLEQAETKLKQAQELIDLQKRKIEALEAAERRAEEEKKAAEDAMLRAQKDGGMTDDTVRLIRTALGMETDAPKA